jgi:hypothetical protein
MNTRMHSDDGRHGRDRRRLRLHLHAPTLDAVIEMLYQTHDPGDRDGVIRLVDAMRPPMAITTMGDLFGHVDGFEEEDEQAQEQEQEQAQEQEEDESVDDGCEICGVRCSSTTYAPYPGLCVRCTAKVQHLQRQKRPPQQGGGVEAR